MLRQDPNLRLVYKEFPILGPVSVTAAYAALAARRQGEYDAFHAAMMEAHGNITDDTVYRVAASLGLDIDKLMLTGTSQSISELYPNQTWFRSRRDLVMRARSSV